MNQHSNFQAFIHAIMCTYTHKHTHIYIYIYAYTYVYILYKYIYHICMHTICSSVTFNVCIYCVLYQVMTQPMQKEIGCVMLHLEPLARTIRDNARSKKQADATKRTTGGTYISIRSEVITLERNAKSCNSSIMLESHQIFGQTIESRQIYSNRTVRY